MSPQELASRISGIAEDAERALEKAITSTQRELFDQMQNTLARLETDGEGLILQSQKNRKLLQKADRVFDKAMKESGYFHALGNYAGALPEIVSANDQYFKFILDSFSIDAQYLKSLQRNSIKTIETLLANDGLTLQLKQPLMEILSQNVNSGASLSDLLSQVRQFVKGTSDLEGKLMRYSKQISRDTLFNFSRSMQEAISENAGLQYYLYEGGLMKESRPFCIHRAGNFYGKKEVEKWASQEWAGKRAGTTSSTIFIYAGGFSCLHSLIPVSEAMVPQDVIDRQG